VLIIAVRRKPLTEAALSTTTLVFIIPPSHPQFLAWAGNTNLKLKPRSEAQFSQWGAPVSPAEVMTL